MVSEAVPTAGSGLDCGFVNSAVKKIHQIWTVVRSGTSPLRSQDGVATSHVRPVYNKRQRQSCENTAMMPVILLSLTTMESRENGLQTHSGVIPLFSIRIVLQAS